MAPHGCHRLALMMQPATFSETSVSMYKWTQNICELRWPLEVDTWEEGKDRKTTVHREREHNHFLVLYDVKQLGSGCRRIATEDSCEQ
jgi:hypothetical protein